MSVPEARTYAGESVKGWIGSILFHLLIIIILYFARVQELEKRPGFVEVAIGSFAQTPAVSSSPEATDVRAGREAQASAPVIVKQSAQSLVNLPERKFPVGDDVLRLPESKKLDVTEESARKSDVNVEKTFVGEKETGAGKALESEKLSGEGKRGTAGEGAGFPGSSVGADIGRAAGYSLQWAGGGTREKISGDLPTYPEGVNVEAQVKLQAVVAVDGSVKSLHPIQKANERLEDAAMNKVRFWKFEALSSTQPQVDQTCTITFNFKLR
jgi:outer membrane biosynthesis protein TonB